MIEVWMRRMEQAWRELSNWNQSKVHIFHHNDTDGLTSGAILTEAFERKGYTVHRYALEKPYPAVLKKIFSQEGRSTHLCGFCGSDCTSPFRAEQGKKSCVDSGSSRGLGSH